MTRLSTFIFRIKGSKGGFHSDGIEEQFWEQKNFQLAVLKRKKKLL